MLRLLLALLIGFLVCQIANLATTVYLHRTLSHRALTLSGAARFPFRVVLWLTTGIKPREWVAVHRKHHAFTDTEGDPHSPAVLGWLRVQLTNPALYRRCARDRETVRRYAKDLPADRWDRVLFDRAFLGLGLGITLLILLLGPLYGLIAAGTHVVAYLGLSGSVNSIGHRFGRRPFANSATNLHWLAFLTAGEGYHNNHHAAPTSARLGFGKADFDPGWWCIQVLRRFGLAKVRLEQVVLAPGSTRSAA